MVSKIIKSLIFINLFYANDANDFFLSNTNDYCHLVQHTSYSACYSELHEQSLWVSYTLYANQLVQPTFASRDGKKFILDEQVETLTASKYDYKNSGYDRGHLMPAADADWSQHSIAESFQFSNISPQNPSFNRGIWKRLEKTIRDLAKQFGKLHIITGPVLTGSYNYIGESKVSVPDYFYKVVFSYSKDDTISIGFIIPNKKSSLDVMEYAVSIDSVEVFTGIDFFHTLEDDIEDSIERNTYLIRR